MTNDRETTFSIRMAQLTDLAGIAQLTRELMEYERQLSPSTDAIHPWAATTDEIHKQFSLPNVRFFVAVENGQVLGYLRAVIVGLQLPLAQLNWRERWLVRLERLARWGYTVLLRRPRPAIKVESGYIAGAYVRPDARRRGLGQGLTCAAENWFRANGLQYSELHVLFNNEAARSMWEELEYKPLTLGMRKGLIR